MRLLCLRKIITINAEIMQIERATTAAVNVGALSPTTGMLKSCSFVFAVSFPLRPAKGEKVPKYIRPKGKSAQP
jgi:hypothetical protein